MKIKYQELEKKINISFKNKNLLEQSLTHKSFNSSKNNEKIEFLGDRVLGLVMAKKLLEIYPNEKEGILDKKYASLVNKKSCLEIAKSINLEKFILKQWEAKISNSVVTEIDAKTKLQEQTLKKFKSLPKYKLISNTGPRHKPVFKVGVKLPNTKYFIGIGNSKKNAEQSAATECLNSFNK